MMVQIRVEDEEVTNDLSFDDITEDNDDDQSNNNEDENTTNPMAGCFLCQKEVFTQPLIDGGL